MKTKKKPLKKLDSNPNTMTKDRICSMQILESEKYIRFLFEPRTKTYFIFNGRLNASHFAKSYQIAQRFYNQLILISFN